MSQRFQAPELSPRSVLVVAAHPDDEVLGCGGTLARLAATGAAVHVAFLADGVGARAAASVLPDQTELAARRAAAEAAGAILGVASLSFGDFPDNRLDTIPLLEIAKSVEALVSQRRPDTLLTHHCGDVNVDHRRVFEAVTVACRPQKDHPVRTLLAFEVASSTEWQLPGSLPPFVPSVFVDISATLDRKLRALAAYSQELRDWPHPRSLRGVEQLARWRGATVGLDAAEAFQLGRAIV